MDAQRQYDRQRDLFEQTLRNLRSAINAELTVIENGHHPSGLWLAERAQHALNELAALKVRYAILKGD